MYMVGVILGAVILKKPILGLNPIVMTFSGLCAAGPCKKHGIRVLDLASPVHLLNDFMAVLGGIQVHQFKDPSLLAGIEFLKGDALRGEESLAINNRIPSGKDVRWSLVGKDACFFLLVV